MYVCMYVATLLAHSYPEGAAVVAAALRTNSSIEDIDIADNYIGVQGASIFGASYKGGVRKVRIALGDRIEPTDQATSTAAASPHVDTQEKQVQLPKLALDKKPNVKNETIP